VTIPGNFLICNYARKCAHFLFVLLPFLSVLTLPGRAQQSTVQLASVADSLPDAPLPAQNDSAKDQTAGTASIAGVVVDSDGAAVSGALVRVLLSDGRQFEALKSGVNGQFVFTQVPAGSYSVTVDASRFTSFQTQQFTVAAGQAYSVPEISLAIAGLNTNVVVRPTEEVAAEQIKAEEKQRALGVFPNFYVSYVPDAAPLTSKQKLSMAVHDTFDWTSFVGVSIGAGIQQANNSFSGYGQGAAGYGKRWGALYADGRTSDLLSHYVFASLLHQDPRYFYQGTGTKKSRLFHALSNGFVARSDNGKTMPNYAYLLGDICSAALSNAYYPESDRGAGLVFTNAGLGIAGRAAQGVIQEFIGKRLTKHSSDSTAP
jgi:hypothetical protein